MRVVQTDQLLRTDQFYMKPFERYVMSDYEVDHLMYKAPKINWKWSVFNSYERRYGGQDLNGKKLCIYRHNAYGDQLIASTVPRYLKALYPDSVIHLYCHPGVRDLWDGNPFVQGGAISIPMAFDAVKQYDYHLFFEGMLEGNSEPDQGNCYDDMFGWCGIDPDKVPREYKRPFIYTLPGDYVFYNRAMSGVSWESPFFLYHMNPDNLVRAVPPALSALIIECLLVEFPEHNVVVVGKDSMVQEVDMEEHIPEDHRVMNLYGKTKSFRDLIPFIQNADCCIVPDSSVMHLAAALNAPTVSLWGIFNPNDRVKYYSRNVSVFPSHVCPHSPCRNHTFELPKEQCKDAVTIPDKEFCSVLASIEPAEVVVAVREVTQRRVTW